MIYVAVNPNLQKLLLVGQTGTTLTCDAIGADNLQPVLTYHWTKDNVTSDRSEILTLSPVRLSHAGVYTCSINVSSTFLNNIIQVSANNTQTVRIQSKYM